MRRETTCARTAGLPDRRTAWPRCLLASTALLLAVSQPASAQELSLSGYFENSAQLDYSDAVGAEFLDAGKLRVDVQGFFGAGFSLVGNVNAIGAVGATERHFAPYLPPSVRAALTAAGIEDTFSIERLRVFVDNLYLSWTGGPLRLRAGRQQLSWGPGYSFNPTDLFHRKTLVDPTYEKEGVTAIRADLQWGFGSQVSLIAKPRDSVFRHALTLRGPAPDAASVAGIALRASTFFEPLGGDIALTLHQVTDSTGLDPVTLTPLGQQRRAVGLEVSGSLLGLGVWLEGNVNLMEREGDFARVLVGADYTLLDGTYLTVEAFYNGRSSAHRPYPLHDWMASLAGEPVGPGWILAGAQRELSALVTGSAFVFATPGGSVALNPRLDVSLLQDFDAVIFGFATVGHQEGAFPPGLYSLVVRGTYYLQF